MDWLLFTLISVFSLSVSVIFQRVLIHRDKTDPYAYVVLFQAVVGVLLTCVAIVRGFELPNIHTVLLPAALSIVFFGAGHIVYAKTLQRVEASAFSILFATQAVWIMLLGIVLLNETMTGMQIAGSVLILAGIVILTKKLRTLLADKGTLLGLLTGLMFGIAIYTWSYVGRFTEPVSWAAFSFIATSLVALAIRPRSVRKMPPLLRPNVAWKLIALGVLYGIGSLAMLLAYKTGTFALVTPIRQTSIVVTVILALTFLPAERKGVKRKLLAALVCVVGTILIVV